MKRLRKRFTALLLLPGLLLAVPSPALALGEDDGHFSAGLWSPNGEYAAWSGCDDFCYQAADGWYFCLALPAISGDGAAEYNEAARAYGETSRPALNIRMLQLYQFPLTYFPADSNPQIAYWYHGTPASLSSLKLIPDGSGEDCPHGGQHQREILLTADEQGLSGYSYGMYLEAFGREPPLPKGWRYVQDFEEADGAGTAASGGVSVIWRLGTDELKFALLTAMNGCLSAEEQWKYSPESLAALAAAYEASRAALLNQDATQQEIDSACADMNDALNALQYSEAYRNARQQEAGQRDGGKADTGKKEQGATGDMSKKPGKDLFDKALEQLKKIQELMSTSQNATLEAAAEKMGIPLDAATLGKILYDMPACHRPGEVNPKLYDLIEKSIGIYTKYSTGSETLAKANAEMGVGLAKGLAGAAENSKIADRTFQESGDIDAAFKKAYGTHYHDEYATP